MRKTENSRGLLLFDGENSTYQYVGEAPIGSSTSTAVWKIYRLTMSGTNSISRAWADGSDLFNKVWDNRATYIYS